MPGCESLVFVHVPKKYTEPTGHLVERGLVPVTVTLGESPRRNLRFAQHSGRAVFTWCTRPSGLSLAAIAAGLVVGLAASAAFNGIVARWSIGNLSDPVVLLATSVVLLAVAVAAALLPVVCH